MKFLVEYMNNTGTASLYIKLNEEYLLEKLNYKTIYPGTLNFICSQHIDIKPDIYGVKLNNFDRLYDLMKCKINGVEGYMFRPNEKECPTLYEFLTDRKIEIINDKLILEVF